MDGNTTNDGSYSDFIIVKYNSSGTKQWTRQLGSSSNVKGFGIATDNNENIYVTGYTEGGLDGNISAGSSDLFVIKYNNSGIRQWTKQLGTSRSDHGYDIITDSSGNIYVTGYTNSGIDGNESAGGADFFVVKYNSSGIKQ